MNTTSQTKPQPTEEPRKGAAPPPPSREPREDERADDDRWADVPCTD